MLAPSGAGGAYFTELLDDNWSVEGTQNKDNNRCSKTNEYAGSPNSFRIDDYRLHVKFNDFPDWNKNTILLGKRFSPIEFFKNHCFENKKKGRINPALFNFISNYLAGGT